MQNHLTELHGPFATAAPGDLGSPILGANGEILGVPKSSVPLALYSPDLELNSVVSASNTTSSTSAKRLGTSNDDVFVGGEGRDRFRGYGGQDQALGGNGRDRLFGGDGDDYLHGGAENDRLNGGSGQDQLIGGSGNDVLVGGNGDDRLYGQSGDDRLRGGQGQDKLDGGNGRDRLFGGSGDDCLTDQDGGDVLTGGDGNDQFWIGNADQGVTRIRDFQVGRDRIKFMELGLTYEQLSFTRKGRDTVISADGEMLVHLQNIAPHHLGQRDFQFGDASLVANLEAALQSSTTPGAMVSVITADGSVWSGANGFVNLEEEIPMSISDRSGIGSITKSMVAVTVLQLVQEGQLSLDDTLAQWLPEVNGKIENSETITLKQLLNHSSGIPEFLDSDFAEAVLTDPGQIWKPEDFLQLAYGEPAEFAPGDRQSYSNTNFTLLGLVVEAATQDTLANQLQSRIFEPLGMESSSIVSEASTLDDFPQGYIFLEKGLAGNDIYQRFPVFFHPSSRGFGEGGAVSTVADLTRFSNALHNGELLTPAMAGHMRQGGVDNATDGQRRYGLGLELFETPVGDVIGHTGGFPGVSSYMLFLPDQQVTLVTIENEEDEQSPLFENVFSTLANF